MPDDELIKKFVEFHSATEELLKQEKVVEAKQKYLDALGAYQDIDKSSLEHFHKELAYDQVTSLFKKVNEAKERVKVPLNLIAAGALVVVFSLLVLFNPSIVGLISLEDLVRQPVDIHFAESGIQQVSLRDRPLSLAASGEFTGKVKLFYKQAGKLELVFSSDNATNNSFTDACVETCEVSAESNSIELFATLEPGSSLSLKELSYKIQRKDNSAPVWKGSTRTFKAQVGKPTTIDLADYFSDPEGDQIVFLSTTDDGLDVFVQDSIVTITPQSAGIKKVVFVASDLLEVTRMGVTLEAE